ncbi:outer membrane lipoprotein-sorting protein [Vibrio spartinae]|uniref:Uncharacterized protein TP-0789 domain-containing protein n=1 Tax=Vibrio spartinae TaxID=1918945 RepID=A0ABX6QVD7_9VIBR|nr:outer membrane lipoprotein-sorting protein [Vibrio spartinae]QMV13119.1 hypothetical protein Vspart_00326 [Vibrio spartinae]
MKNYLTIAALLYAGLSFAGESVDTVLTKVRDRNDGHDYVSQLKLVNKTEGRMVNERQMLMLQKDIDTDEVMVLAVQAPVDVRDVSFLIKTYQEAKGEEDEQWMFLPAFRKVRRISSQDKRGAFMGSEFEYFDLDKLRVSDFNSKILREEKVGERPAVVIERIPVSQDVINKSGYHRVIIWVDKEREIVLRQDYYNAKGILFKRQHTESVKHIQNIWTIMHSVMDNLVEGKSSELIYNQTQYNVGLGEQLFRKGKLKRGYKMSDLPDSVSFSTTQENK